MAYITSEQVQQKRAAIKAAFPNWKFSITKHNYSTISVSILEADILLTVKKNETVNPYWIRQHYENNPLVQEMLLQLFSICNEGNFDKSDMMSDYHHVGFYVNISIGEWNRPFKLILKNKEGKPVAKVSVKELCHV